MMPGKRKAMDKSTPTGSILERLEKTKASIRAKVEHPFRVIKRQFGYVKVKYRGLAKNTANLMTPFALSNLWMVRKRLLNGRDECARETAKGPRLGLNTPRICPLNAKKMSSSEITAPSRRVSGGCARLSLVAQRQAHHLQKVFRLSRSGRHALR